MSKCKEGQCTVGHAGEYSDYRLYTEKDFFESVMMPYNEFVDDAHTNFRWGREEVRGEPTREQLLEQVLEELFNYCLTCGQELKTPARMKKYEEAILEGLEKRQND